MANRIDEDHKQFRDVVSGKAQKSIQKYVDTGHIFKLRPNGKGQIAFPLRRIITPRFVHNDYSDGIGRGPGKKGDIIKKDGPGKGGDKAGDDHEEGIEIQIDMEWILHTLQEELQLPNLKPKDQDFDEIEYKYNSLSLTGPQSLRHTRKTLLVALKRLIASGRADDLHEVPGLAQKVKLINPISSDFRFRQYKEIRKPASNAVIFFARDSSGSMTDYKCDIVSDIAWWLDTWIRFFYKRTERIYVCHDTEAEEVDEQKFYRYRQAGGTRCSSALKLISEQFKHRFTPHKWNIYVFYFTDGENEYHDNDEFCEVISKEFGTEIVNFTGICQIMCNNYSHSLKEFVDEKIKSKVFKEEYVRTISVGSEESHKGYNFNHVSKLSDDERNEHVKRAIKKLLGAPVKK